VAGDLDAALAGQQHACQQAQQGALPPPLTRSSTLLPCSIHSRGTSSTAPAVAELHASSAITGACSRCQHHAQVVARQHAAVLAMGGGAVDDHFVQAGNSAGRRTTMARSARLVAAVLQVALKPA
jgi:hypothetical protein